jgi:hypothetical protein
VSYTNKRIYYAIKAAGIAECGTVVFTAVHGGQSAGMNTRFNLEEVFELGQIEIYELIENIPDVECTIEKVIDGYPLVYHLATKAATSATLAGRSNKRATVALAFYQDDQDAASGTPCSEVVLSGMYIQSLQYSFPTQGNCTESVTFVGNNKVWYTGGFLFTPSFNNTDGPVGTGGVQRREDVKFGLAGSLLPTQIPGITSTGTNELQADGSFGCHIARIQVSCNLGRDALYELGKRGPYHRFAQFPTRVQCEIETITIRGDMVNALEEATSNLVDQTIRIWTNEGTKIDLGAKNKLSSITQGGANAQANGGNETVVYSYENYNSLKVQASSDPAGL